MDFHGNNLPVSLLPLMKFGGYASPQKNTCTISHSLQSASFFPSDLSFPSNSKAHIECFLLLINVPLVALWYC